jgi:lipopolysaccharide transport system ATP-binding protein
VYNSAAVFGLSTAETDAVYDQIVDFAEIPEAMETPVQNYSAGMRARLGYAVVAHVQPDILLIDEVLAVGDISFRRKCLEHIVRYRKNGGTLVVVAHDLYMLQTTCTRCLILETGRLVYEGDVTEGFARYYTFMNEPLPAGAVSSAEPKPPDEPPATALPVPASTPTPGLSDAYPVAVESISIRGLSSPEVRTGEDAVIEVRYRSLKAFEHVRWGFNVHTLDNVRITTGLLGFDGELFPLNVGEGSLCCRVSRLPLVAGTYLISSGIVDVKTKAVLAQGYDTPIRFTVTSDATETGNLHLFLKSLVVFDVHRHDP